jgi:hypothetical protein
VGVAIKNVDPELLQEMRDFVGTLDTTIEYDMMRAVD